MRKIQISIIFFVSLFLQGCAIGVIAAGAGAMKAGNAKKKEAQIMENAEYGKYRIEMEKINLEREKANLPIKAIMTFEEWVGGEKEHGIVPFNQWKKEKKK